MQYFILYKPYGVICQFTPEVEGQATLSTLFSFPPQVYPVGRLDLDSEGLLLLTDDSQLNERLLHPRYAHERTYWVQVEGAPREDDLGMLRNGMEIRVNKSLYRTRPARVRIIPPPAVGERNPPIRFRKHIPDTWLEIQLTEGKNRQVRKMCAAAGFPVLRLIRCAIGSLTLEGMGQGEVRIIERKTLLQKLGIKE